MQGFRCVHAVHNAYACLHCQSHSPQSNYLIDDYLHNASRSVLFDHVCMCFIFSKFLKLMHWTFSSRSTISDKTHETDCEFSNSLSIPPPPYSMLGCPFYLQRMAKHPYHTQLPKLYWGEEEEPKQGAKTDYKCRVDIKYLLSR